MLRHLKFINMVTMKKLLLAAPLFILLSVALTGCYYDKENELYPTGTNCDTTGVISYASAIAPIMVQNCNVCHSGANPQGSIITSDYANLSVIAKSGQLWAAVNHENGIAMPQGGDKLPQCDLTKIKKWVDSGSPNN